MKIFIPTWERSETIQTHKNFEGLDYKIVVHNDEQAEKYLKNPTIDEAHLVVSNVDQKTGGLPGQREWVRDNFIDQDEWFVFADDNIRQIEAVREDYYSAENLDTNVPREDGLKWDKIYKNKLTPERFLELAKLDCEHADSIGAELVGFALVDNPFFHTKKYRPVGYVIGKLMLVKNGNVHHHSKYHMEDFHFTAEHLLQNGKVLINNFMFPRAGHYEKGGLGSYAERLDARRKDCVALMEAYPGLFRFKNRKGFEENTDLAIRFNSLKQVEKWREEMKNV